MKKGGREAASRERADSLLGWSTGWAAFSGKRWGLTVKALG